MQQRGSPTGRIIAAIVAGLLMLPAGYLYLVSGLVVPEGYLLGLWVLFLGLLTVLVVLARRRSYWVLAIPVLAGVLWFVLLTLGERLLGWTG